MANINLYDAYNQKRRKFGVNDTPRFRDSFVDAVNLTYAEMNDMVFQSEVLSSIGSFDDVIDDRLAAFTTLTFDAGSNTAIGNREFWSAEYNFERLSDTNSFTDTISDDAFNVVISITDGVLSIVGDSINGTLSIPSLDSFKLRFDSYSAGNRVFIDDDEYALTFTVGDGDTTQSIGTVSTHIISGTSGYTLNRVRFLSSASVFYDFLINEGTGTTLTDLIASYTITVSGEVWQDIYIEPSSSLDVKYLSVFNIALDYHLQDGGEWAIEPEGSRYLKWYGDPSRRAKGGLQMARSIFQNNSTYTGPLGI